MNLRDFLKDTKILFKNPEVFTEKYIPERILGRDEQIRELASYLKYAVRGHPHPNVIIYGKVGTGKSVVMLYILREIEKIVAEEGLDSNFKYVYVLCRNYKTEGQIIEKIVSDLKGRRVSLTGWGISKYYETLRKTLSEVGGVVTVVLDEANLMTKANDVLYNLSRMDVPNADVCTICITNSLKFFESLESRVISSLSPVQVVFPPYTAKELEEILRDRARIGIVDGALEDGVIELCAAIAAQREGDARRAIALLKTAVQIAEEEGSDKVSIAHVKKAVEVFERDIVRQALMTLPTHAKAILLAMAACIEAGLTVGNGVRSGDLYAAYVKICKTLGLDAYTQRRVSDIVSELEELELVHARLQSLGRGKGRSRIISFGGEPAYFRDVILEDARFSGLPYQELLRSLRRDSLLT